MIHVRNLTKNYGDYAAVRDVSFDVPAGQIVGFLGPNGAGKTTTMRILTGYMTATSGQATIAGFDIFWKPLEARRRIGYLPESCPLYHEMRVGEYLHFRAGIKGLHGSARRKARDSVMDRCWLTEVSRQLIGTLSKGFRQRVGLADALLGDPPVLILDEPTSGLDPTQIRETRRLIRELGKKHTILLSTHILPEVEMTCDQVIIIHGGKVVASGSLEDLAKQTGSQHVVVAEFEGSIDPAPVSAVPGVKEVTSEATATGTRLRIVAEPNEDVAARLCALAVECGWKVREVRPQQETLEERFVRIISRDEAPV
ncbi:MAG: ABC transporter ATP-binding protein [Gemmataceae bacterium]|nr:ABC transporter ATP-binding protein [Gemmataceae bacterium]